MEITQSTTVTPFKETPKHKIWLSNLDIVAARGYTPLVYFYPSTGQNNHIPDEVFKDALAKALVLFYPFAGRLSRNLETGRPEIDCTGEGVKFLTVDLNATIDEFKDFVPSAKMRNKLVPVVKSADPPCGILMVQKFAGGERVSTFRAVAAYVWKCTCIARGLASDVESELLLPVDMRDRFKPPLPPNFIGNPTLRTKTVAKVEELLSNTIEFGANLIEKAIERITDEYVRSLIDHLETIDLVALSKRGPMNKTSLMAISWLKYPMYDADFGWGKPILMARGQMYGSGYVYLNHLPEKNGGISVIIGLEPDSLQCFKKIFYTRSSRL